MCDYSLHGVASRPAQVGDKLITNRFINTATLGLSPVGKPNLAVCLLPGTEIAFDAEVVREPAGFLLTLLKRRPDPIRDRVAIFRQIHLNNPCTHHDALEFPDGQVLLLTHLRAGQRATVLQLPVRSATQAEERSERRVESSYHLQRHRSTASGGMNVR
jgi:hypothetical protein